MVQGLSLPSWREDAPSAAETAILSALAQKNMGVAGTQLMVERGRNAQAQNDYHDYFNQVSALQQQNMQQEKQIEFGKMYESALKNPTPGAIGALKGMGMFPNTDTSQFERSLADAQHATITHNMGLGIGGMAAGGESPEDLSRTAGPFADGTYPSFLPPALVQGQQAGAAGRVAASPNAPGASKSTTETTHYITPGDITSGTVKETTVGHGNGAPTGAPPGLGGAVRYNPNAPQPSAGGAPGGGPKGNAGALLGPLTDEKGNPINDTQPGGVGAPTSAATTQPTTAQPTDKDLVNRKMIELSMKDKGAYANVLKGAAQNPGGGPLLQRDAQGKITGFYGADGHLYN